MVNITGWMSMVAVEADVILRFKDGTEAKVGEMKWEAPVTVVAGEAVVQNPEDPVIIRPREEEDL